MGPIRRSGKSSFLHALSLRLVDRKLETPVGPDSNELRLLDIGMPRNPQPAAPQNQCALCSQTITTFNDSEEHIIPPGNWRRSINGAGIPLQGVPTTGAEGIGALS